MSIGSVRHRLGISMSMGSTPHVNGDLHMCNCTMRYLGTPNIVFTDALLVSTLE